MHCNRIFVSIFSLIITSPAFAIFCPTNFNEINIGDSLLHVKQQCGNPSAEKQAAASNENVPQEWNYYLQVNPSDQATLKMIIAFNGGKVTNMSVNGIGISNTAICGATIQVGDSQASVKGACGKPVFINQMNTPESNSPTIVTELTYNTTAGSAVFLFENGKLTAKK